jgi:protein SCO1/2
MSTLRSIARVPIRAAMACAVLAAGPAGAETAARVRRELAEVGVEERLGASVPLEAAFTGDDGRPIALGALAGRPILLSFNYTTCPRLCGLQLGGLARALRELPWDGGRFSVATVSIDPEEKLPQLRRYKEAFVREAGGGEGIARGWRFLAGARGEIDALARAVGFRYRYDPKTAEFAHQATLVVLTADGRVSGYLHGISYPSAALRAALERAEAGRVASASEQATLGGFLLTCMGLDPADPAPLALKIMRAGGTAAFLFLLAFLGVHAVRDFRLRRSRARADAPAAR